MARRGDGEARGWRGVGTMPRMISPTIGSAERGSGERQRVREEKMVRWTKMSEGNEPWDRLLEIELFGKIVTKGKEPLKA